MKIDTSRIDGYAEMTTDEKLAALESYEIEPSGPEIQKWKDAVSRANSEAAEYKKQLRAKLSDDEAKQAQDAEEREAILKELESLRRDQGGEYIPGKIFKPGYDAQSAQKAAKALQAGDFDTVFATQEAFIETAKKSAVAQSLKTQPSLTSGDPLGGEDVESAALASFRKAAGV